MYDKIEDLIYWLGSNIKVSLNISIKDNNEKYPTISIYDYSNSSKQGLKLQLATGLNIEYNKYNQETRFYDKMSIFISESYWYSFISGLIDSVKLFDKLILYTDDKDGSNIPYINRDIKTKYIKIENLSSKKASLIIRPCIYEEDGLENTIKYHTGFEMYINSQNHFSFIEEEKFKSFVYMMEKYSLVSESRLLFNNALLINQLNL